MALGTKSDQLMSEINVTPLVDVMLVLLIIFMVAAPMMTQGVDVNLPQAPSKSLPSEDEQVIITVNKEKEIFIDKNPVTLDYLRNELKMVMKGRENRQVYLRADKDIPYGVVVRVMSEVKEAGIEKLGMITVPFTEKEEKDITTGKK